jgi:hypothetical protein
LGFYSKVFPGSLADLSARRVSALKPTAGFVSIFNFAILFFEWGLYDLYFDPHTHGISNPLF